MAIARDNNVMHAKPDLRVVLKWMINRSGSVITDVIPLELVPHHQIKFGLPKLLACVAIASFLVALITSVQFSIATIVVSVLTFASLSFSDLAGSSSQRNLTLNSLGYLFAYASISIIVAFVMLLIFPSVRSTESVATVSQFLNDLTNALRESFQLIFTYLIGCSAMTTISLILVCCGKQRPKLKSRYSLFIFPGFLVMLYTTFIGGIMMIVS